LALDVAVVGIVCLLAAEVTNTAQLGDRFTDWLVLGIIYVVLGATEGFLAVGVILRPAPWA
jgi:hypothetical protein